MESTCDLAGIKRTGHVMKGSLNPVALSRSLLGNSDFNEAK